MKRAVVGIAAHVDAGKTTLIESLLYVSGMLRKQGRVDHRDCFLDTHSIERRRGITVFSKQALITLPDSEITLIDTPGHTDFSAETERALDILDAAVLVISGTEGVQAHTETLWKLLKQRKIPVFIFVTKMDLTHADSGAVHTDLLHKLGPSCIDYKKLGTPDCEEELALLSESALNDYLQSGKLSIKNYHELISKQLFTPVFFGSGLKNEGVAELLKALETFVCSERNKDELSAIAYKISRDSQGARVAFFKINSGVLHVRENISYTAADGAVFNEKITQLRRYSGNSFEQIETAETGMVCGVLGLSSIHAGDTIGNEKTTRKPSFLPVMSYSVCLPEGTDAKQFYGKLIELQDEDPLLNLEWNESLQQILIHPMGKVQIEVLTELIDERFHVPVTIENGRVIYYETISEPVYGFGHFEPLRHYAEVHLLLEPLPRGSGIIFDTNCPLDELDLNWQRLILTNLEEKQHLGVLTGSPITDIKITLISGKAHVKHTEGGDFRQAVYRAVRQGLMKAKSVLLEPFYRFIITVPSADVGKALSDIKAMNGDIEDSESREDVTLLNGIAPAASISDYSQELASYTHGKGRLVILSTEYRPCQCTGDIINQIGYDPLRDIENPPDSVFCSHGSGTIIPWNNVEDYLHLPVESFSTFSGPDNNSHLYKVRNNLSIDDRELEAVLRREFGEPKRELPPQPKYNEPQKPKEPPRPRSYIIDGYNLIYSWELLNELVTDSMPLARSLLLDILSGYAAYSGAGIYVVFDGYKRRENPGERFEYHGINVAYTAENETADAMIERTAYEIGKNYAVSVVTSDNLIRLSALKSGVLRVSSKSFSEQLESVMNEITKVIKNTNTREHMQKLSEMLGSQ